MYQIEMEYRAFYNKFIFRPKKLNMNKPSDFELESAKILFPNLFCDIFGVDLAVYNEVMAEKKCAEFSLDDYLSNSEFLRRF